MLLTLRSPPISLCVLIRSLIISCSPSLSVLCHHSMHLNMDVGFSMLLRVMLLSYFFPSCIKHVKDSSTSS